MKRLTSLLRPRALAMAAGAVAALACGTASAQTTFTGFTNGCFGAACVPETTNAGASDVLAGSGLTYNNSTFDVVSAGGVAGLGSTGMLTPAGNVDNLGSWLLSGTAFNYGGNTFTLRVSFTAPPGTTPTSALFTSTLTGNVISTDNGGLFIDFDNTPAAFTFTGGSFDLIVNDVSLTPGASPVASTGFINVTSVPEPETYALFLAGLGAVGFMARRRKS
jgi:hypothetical protein